MSIHAFTNPVFDSQRVFRAAMNALAQPGTLQAFDAGTQPPSALTPELAALVLAFADHETPVWLDRVLSASKEAADFIRFHTGAPITGDPGEAAFALVADAEQCPPLMNFTMGTPDYPDRSTTIFLRADTLRSSRSLTLKGPGIAGTSVLRAEPLMPDFVAAWAANRALFPRGVDLLIACDGWLAGLPRTTEVNEA